MKHYVLPTALSIFSTGQKKKVGIGSVGLFSKGSWRSAQYYPAAAVEWKVGWEKWKGVLFPLSQLEFYLWSGMSGEEKGLGVWIRAHVLTEVGGDQRKLSD